jgi:hypothetical protein
MAVLNNVAVRLLRLMHRTRQVNKQLDGTQRWAEVLGLEVEDLAGVFRHGGAHSDEDWRSAASILEFNPDAAREFLTNCRGRVDA